MKKFTLSIIMLAAALNAHTQTAEEHWVDSVYNSLTAEQRIGQLFNVRANLPNKPFDDRIVGYVKKYNIGGVTFFGTDSKSMLNQSNAWQGMAKTPIMVSVDSEWGLGMRLTDAVSYPYQITLGAVQNDSLIAEMGRQIAEQCHRLGVHSTFAPVIDVNSNPKNPVIGMRSFGENPEKVASKGAVYALTLQKNGVLPTMKHFPGHGDAQTDSHQALPKIDRPLNEIEQTELYPFQSLIDKDVAGIMVGHLYMPALEPVANKSSSLSKNIVTGLLKDKMHFNGLIFTDALDMKGAYANSTPDSTAYYALMAGNDVLLTPLNLDKSLKIIKNAADKDNNVAKRVEESCKKILRYKYRLGLTKQVSIPTERLDNDLQRSKYYELKQRIYNEAVTLLRNKNNALPLKHDDKKIAVVTNDGNNDVAKALKEKGWNINSYIINDEPKLTTGFMTEMKKYDYVIVNIRNTSINASSNFGISKEMALFVTTLSTQNKLIFNLFASPYALDIFKMKDPASVIVAYENNQMAVNSVVGIMTGEICPKGVLPVTVNLKYKAGSGLTYDNFFAPDCLPISLIDNKYTRKIDSIAENGIKVKAYPGCQIVALKDGEVVYDKCFGHFTYDAAQPVTKEAVYDIASLTKIFASTFAIMKLYDEKKIDLNEKLSDYFPYLKGTDKEDIRIIDIMTHQSGLKPWFPFYKYTIDEKGNYSDVFRTAIDESHSVRVAENLYVSNDYKYAIVDTIINSKLGEKKYKYSDVGFYFIPKIVEMVTNTPFEKYISDNFYKPLGVNNIFFKPLDHVDISKIVPTEDDKVFRKQLLRGDVDDQAAALLGGVAGHAGLFANATDLAVMMQFLLNDGSYNGKKMFSSSTIRKFTSAPFANNDNFHGIGFNKLNRAAGIKHNTASLKASDSSFGHTGFTGTFVWADPENQLVVVFLSNRVHPDADNNKLIELDIRTKIHELFYDAVR